MKRLSFLLLSICITLSAIAHDFEVNGLCYNITSETEKTVRTTYRDGIPGTFSGDIVIPPQVTNNGVTYTVTCIGYKTFLWSSQITSMIIPNTVTQIDAEAFLGCWSMTKITVPNSIQTIASTAFDGCSGLPVINNVRYADNILVEYLDKSASSVTIKAGTRYIAPHAFSGCNELTTVELPSSVTNIEANAFDGCPNLQTITLSDNLEKIGEYAFVNCKQLNSIHLTRNVNNICLDAFINCSGINSITVDPGNSFYDSRSNCNSIIETESGMLVIGCKTSTIPNSVISIRDHAFYGCTDLKTIAIPKSLSAVGTDVFFGCDNLESITVDSANRYLDSRNDCNAIIETATGTLIRGCNNSTIPDGVKVIVDHAFYNCDKLATVNFPTGLTSIGNKAFYQCAALTDFVLPNTLVTIGDNAFDGCASIKTLVIPNSVATLGSEALKDLTNLEALTIGNGLTDFNLNTLKGTENIKFLSLDTPVIVEAEWSTYVRYMREIFGANIEEVIIGDSVKALGAYAFANFENLHTIKLGKNIKKIGEYALGNCPFVDINLPEGLEEIEWAALYQCRSLKSLWIPKTCTKIGEYSFRSCNQIESIVVEDGNLVYDSRDNCNAIVETATNTIIRGCMNSTIPNTITKIGTQAFWECTNLKSVKIPDSVTTIGEAAFCNCSGLEYVELGKNVQDIDKIAFYSSDKSSIKTVKINSQAIVGKKYEPDLSPGYHEWSIGGIFPEQPVETFIIGDDVTSIGESAFYTAHSMKNIVIGKNVQWIGATAFQECDNLTTITLNSQLLVGSNRTSDNLVTAFNSKGSEFILGDNVTSIGNNAFAGGSNVTSVIIGENVKSIGNDAFKGCAMKTVEIPNSVETIGDEAFYQCSNLRGATIGTGATTVGAKAFLDTALEGLRVEATTPPECKGDIVSDEAYHTVYLETLNDSYATADIWKKFTNFHPTAVDKINTDASDVVPVAYYDLNGIQYTEPQQGINIVRYSDGTVKKINVK